MKELPSNKKLDIQSLIKIQDKLDLHKIHNQNEIINTLQKALVDLNFDSLKFFVIVCQIPRVQ